MKGKSGESMKKKMKMKKHLLMLLLVVCTIVSATLATSAEESTTAVKKLDGGAVAQQIQDITSYRSEGDFTAPKAPEGYSNYVFAGWYTDAACTKANALGKDVTSDTIGEDKSAYAKFVPEEVLSVRAQIIGGTTYASATSNIRFVTTVDSLNYESVGFDFVCYDGTKLTGESQEVYKKLYVLDSNGKVMNYTPWNVFHSMSKYFMACNIRDVANEDFGHGFTATPYWITLDGTKVTGVTATKTINMGYTPAMVGVTAASEFTLSRVFDWNDYTDPLAAQGGCTDGTYYYQAFIKSSSTVDDTAAEVYIRKYNLANGDEDVSADLNLHHANDITYNPDLKYGEREGLLVVIHNAPVYNRLSFVNPDDLKIVDPWSITDLDGNAMSWAWTENKNSEYLYFGNASIIGGGIYSMEYNSTHKKYVVGLSGRTSTNWQKFTFLDENMAEIADKYDPSPLTYNYTTQGNAADDGYIYFILHCSPFVDENAGLEFDTHVISVFDWNGNFVTVLQIPENSITVENEVENISIYNNNIYIGTAGSGTHSAVVYKVSGAQYEETTNVASIVRNGSTEYYTSLEDAMMDAEADETITILAENVEVSSPMEMVNENVTLTNAAGVDVTVTRKAVYTGLTLIDNSAPNFTIKSNTSGSLTFDGTGTQAGNSWIANSVDGELSLEGITVQNVSMNQNGGTVRVESGQVTIKDCVFKNNKNSAEGGAIYSNATLTVEDSVFESNSASNGGAICNRQETAILTVTNCTFGGASYTDETTGETVGLGNTATGAGGAIYNGGSGTVIVNGDGTENSVFEENSAGGANGGGAICIGTGTLTLNGYAFENNTATYQGGAIALRGGLQSTISNATFDGNTAEGVEGNKAETGRGGAIHNRSHRPTITNCTFNLNTAILGGALYNEYNGQVTFNVSGQSENKVFSGNSAGSGGAITNTSGKVSVTGYTFDNNQANKVVIGTNTTIETTTAEDGTETSTEVTTNVYSNAYGGAIYSKKMEDAYDTTVETTDCVFTANTSAANGGAIFNDTSAVCTVKDTMFQNNKAGANGGAIYNNANLTLTGTKGDEENVTAIFDNNGFIEGASSTCAGAAIYNASSLTTEAYVFQNHIITGNGGAVCNYGNNPTFTNCQFKNNQGAIGGAIYSGGGCKIYLEVSDTLVLEALCEGNSATIRGGAIGVGYGHTYVDGYEFKGNHAPYGGAIYLQNQKETKDADGNIIKVGTDSSITNSTFIGNYTNETGGTTGGAVQVDNGTVDAKICIFDSNTSTTHGGAIFTKAVTNIEGCTFTSNHATNQGGAIKVEGSTAQLNITKTTFGGEIYEDADGNEVNLGNIAGTSGGAIYNAGNAITTVGTQGGDEQTTEIFENNIANAEFGGGAICVGSGTLRVYGYTFTDNYAAKEGGAIAKRGDAEFTVKDASFESNESGTIGGAIRSYATTSTIENTTFTKNIAATRGGAIYILDREVELTGSSFNGNQAVYGGAINCEGGTLTADSCHFSGNISTADMTTDDAKTTELTGRGGGAVNLTGNADGTFTGTGTFTSNTAENALGGAIYTTDSELLISGYTFSENVAYHAGAILIDNVMEDAEGEELCDTDITISDSKFEKNQSTEDGGAIYSIQRKLILEKINADAETVFDDNYSAGDGGAIKLENVGGELEVSNYTFINNGAGAQGGAIECHADKATISSCTFGGEGQGNTAGTNGGAFYAGTSCVTEFKIAETVYTDAKFVENKATTPTYGGGAVCMGSGNLTITGYTFEDNTSGTQGGAIHHNATAATMNITNSIFDTNIAETYGGAITGNGTDVTLDNTKFVSNKANVNRGGAIYVWGGSVVTLKVEAGTDLALFQKNESKDGGGAICMGSGELQVTGYTFDDNNTENFGGAVRLNNSAIKASFTNSTFSNNDANTQGGAIFSGYAGADAVAFDVTNCKFDTNGSKYGGAIYIHTGNQKVTLTGGTNALFTNNKATADGGAIYFDKSQNTESSINGYAFSNNSATEQGGAIGLGTTTLTVSDSDFTGNSSVYGGAINSYASSLTATGCDFTSNKSIDALTDSLIGRGGGALNIVGNSTAIINGGTFNSNSTNNWGGAIYTTDSSLTIDGSILDSNTAKHAAAILIDNACEEGDTLNTDTIYVRNTEIKGNISTNSGGAIYVNNRNLTLEKTISTANAIVSGNQSQTGAGGAIFMGSGNLTIKGYTFNGNIAKTTGGAIHHAHATSRLDIYSSVFTLNQSGGSGGAILVKSYMEVDDCEFNQNESTGNNGGAISLDSITTEDKAVIKNSTFDQNKATTATKDLGEGSSINMPGGTWLTLENCQFTNGETRTDTTYSNCGFGDVRLGNNSSAGGLKISGKMVVDVYFNQKGPLTVSGALTEGSNVVANWRKDKVTGDTFTGINFASEADMNASKGYITLSDNQNSTYAIKFIDTTGTLVKATKVTTEEEFNNALTAISESDSKIGAIVLGADIPISAFTEFPTGCDITVVDDGTARKFIRSADYTGYMLSVTSDATVTFASTGGDNTNPRLMIDGADVACTAGNTLLENYGTLTVCQGVALQNNQTSGGNQGIALYSKADSNTTFKGAIRNITSTLASGSNPSSVAVYGTVTFDNAVVENNVTNNCGLVRTFAGGTLIANNTEFKNNQAGTNGGIFNIAAGSLTANGCTFTNNTAGGNGGAIYNFVANTKIINCKFDGNTAGGNGGAIYNGNSVAITITGDGTDNSIFINNKANGTYGGAIGVGSGKIDVDRYKFDTNTAKTNGGAIYITGSGTQTSEITYCDFANNQTTGNSGGAMYVNASGIVEVSNSNFNSNHAKNKGGAICIEAGTATIITCDFIKNSADSDGGAIRIAGNVDGDISDVTLNGGKFENNTSGGDGGAIKFNSGTLTVTGYVFTGNTASGGGNALSTNGSGATLTSCTFKAADVAGSGYTDGGGNTLVTEEDSSGDTTE